jgi:hypothetical protein
MPLPPLNQVKGMEAARLRQRKHAALHRFHLPAEGLPGSLALTHRRCGKATCRCAEGEGHPQWLLTFMVDGRKRVEAVPAEWVEDVQRRVTAGRAAKDALNEVLTANAELLALEKAQRARKRGRKKRP